MSELEHLPPLGPSSRAVPAWREWVTTAVDLLFPALCPLCQAKLGPGRRDPLCGPCWRALERIEAPICVRCGRPILSAPDPGTSAAGPPRGGGPRCGDCRRHPPSFAYARAAARYEGRVRDALHALKYGRRRALAAPLGDLAAEVGEPARGEGEVLVPVPLHPRRERERGFNQASLLAQRIGRAWDVPVATDVLVRRVDTASQTELDAPGRRANVRGAFALRRPGAVAGRHVLLVDDVLTTGATVGACAACLQRGGAAVVGVLTVARALTGPGVGPPAPDLAPPRAAPI